MTASIRFENVRKSYGETRRGSEFVAFESVSLDVAASEFLCIVGPSGCGKSTLLRMAAGLTTPSAGRVLVDGQVVVGPPKGVVYLFQQYAKSLFAWRTVRDNVLFPLQIRGVPRGQARDLAADYLRQVGLDAFATRFPWQLSGGMQQRVAIARALAAEPDVLLLDEPFSAVDALTRLELQSLVLDLWQKRRFTAVLVTHDVEEAVFLADRVAVMSHRPTTLARVLDVPLPRPRDQITTREDARYLALRHDLMAQMLTRPVDA